MIQKCLKTYIEKTFSDEMAPISVLSRSEKGSVLVDDERCLYNFDKITKKVYEGKKVPSSADALMVHNNAIVLAEFKSGFKRRITKNALDDSKLKCPDDEKKTCKAYGALLIKKGKLETDELLDSIKFKAIESYVTLEKKMIPGCEGVAGDKYIRIIYCVVIDDYVDDLEYNLLELANTTLPSNSFSCIKDSLSRFVNIKTLDGKDYYYDEVKVLSPYEFKKYVDKMSTS